MLKSLSIPPSTVMNPRATARLPARGAGWLSETASLWLHRSRTRRVLATLDDRLLNDLGLTAAEVSRECEKPFWRA